MEIDLEKILTEVILKLKPLDKEGKQRVLDAISTFYSLGSAGSITSYVSHVGSSLPSVVPKDTNFSSRSEATAKEFLREKAPNSDVERVVCLAYYLSHYRQTPHFKTIDISKLNTESAQPKFSNAAYAVDHAYKRGYLVPAGKGGMKQISAMGEQYVAALPDRGEAKSIYEQMRFRKTKKPSSRSSSKDSNSDQDGNNSK